MVHEKIFYNNYFCNKCYNLFSCKRPIFTSYEMRFYIKNLQIHRLTMLKYVLDEKQPSLITPNKYQPFVFSLFYNQFQR